MKPHADQPVLTAGADLAHSSAAVIMVHGRNASPANILDLVPALDRPSLSYLAPSAAGRTWYPYSFLAPIPDNEPGISSGLFVLDRLIGDLNRRGIAKSRIALLGFSQGACLAAEFSVRHADRFGGLIVFSGGLIGPPGTEWNYPGTFEGAPVFLGCSNVDPHIPLARVEESAAVFTRMGASVTKRIYPGMGHLVNEDEIVHARAILDQLVV
ncbi:MAG TPA: dienelactone hydrolase family protein [Vicinamibacterales bacterium]|nr:dienelactone hydrolase family protein [Vicinamibacterales bacterium]